MKKNCMVHCSFDLVDHFEPRVPKNRIEGKKSEDGTIARICVASDIRNAINAIPGGGQTVQLMQQMGMPMIIHAYYLYSDEFIKPSEEQLPDVELTGERWLLKVPDKVYRRDYEITDAFFWKIKDRNGKEGIHMVGCNLKQVKFQDNIDNFCNACHIKREKYPEQILFRTIMTNIGPELIKKFFS